MTAVIPEDVLQRSIQFVDMVKKAVESGDKTPLSTMAALCKTAPNYASHLISLGFLKADRKEPRVWLSTLPVESIARKIILKNRRYQQSLHAGRRKKTRKVVVRKYSAPVKEEVVKPRQLTSVDAVIKYVDIARKYGVNDVNGFVKEMMNGSAREVVHA